MRDGSVCKKKKRDVTKEKRRVLFCFLQSKSKTSKASISNVKGLVFFFFFLLDRERDRCGLEIPCRIN